MDEQQIKERLQKAQTLFNDLKLEGWSQAKYQLKQGHQAAVIPVVHTDGRRGVFRYVEPRKDIDSQRFHRELNILTQFKHPNIVTIYEYTTDPKTHWYISELGVLFQTHWERQRKRFKNDPNTFVKLAINTYIQIIDG